MNIFSWFGLGVLAAVGIIAYNLIEEDEVTVSDLTIAVLAILVGPVAFGFIAIALIHKLIEFLDYHSGDTVFDGRQVRLLWERIKETTKNEGSKAIKGVRGVQKRVICTRGVICANEGECSEETVVPEDGERKA